MWVWVCWSYCRRLVGYKMRKLLIGLLLSAGCYGTTLTGTLSNPDGTGATGTLSLSLSQQAALLSTGGCGGPAEIVPTYQVRITVTSGSMSGMPTVYGNDCLAPAGTFYNVNFYDANGNLIFTDRWLITGSSINIGTIVSAVISGTTQTIGGGIILSTPGLSQTVTQPAGTSLSVNTEIVTSSFTAPSGF